MPSPSNHGTPQRDAYQDSAGARTSPRGSRVSNETSGTDGYQENTPVEWPSTCPDCDSGPIIADSDEAVCMNCTLELHNETLCPECNGLVTTDASDDYCEDCGLVLSDSTSSTTDFEGERWEQTGAARTETGKGRGAGTVIDPTRDGRGKSLDASRRKHAQKLSKWQKRLRTRGSSERTLEYAMNELSRMCSALGTPTSVRETAAILYRQAAANNIHKGYSVEAVASATLYIAARMENVPRTFDEISCVSRDGGTRFKRAVSRVKDQLDITLEPVDPAEYVPRIASDLDVDDDVKRNARDLIEEQDPDISGRSPPNVAAAALYAASTKTGVHQITQDEVAEASDVSLKTISTLYRKLSRD